MCEKQYMNQLAYDIIIYHIISYLIFCLQVPRAILRSEVVELVASVKKNNQTN